MLNESRLNGCMISASRKRCMIPPCRRTHCQHNQKIPNDQIDLTKPNIMADINGSSTGLSVSTNEYEPNGCSRNNGPSIIHIR